MMLVGCNNNILIENTIREIVLPCHHILASTKLLEQCMQEFPQLISVESEALKTKRAPIQLCKVETIISNAKAFR
jgi:hypothetical protein